MWILQLRYFCSLRFVLHHQPVDLPPSLDFVLARVFPLPGLVILLCPHSSDILQYRNFYLLSIGYGFRPRLRPRLTQSRSALLWKPWIFGLKDSHLHLATHSGILSSVSSTIVFTFGFVLSQIAPLPILILHKNSVASVSCFSPGYFRRRFSRLVSYYALFKCVAASKPTS